MKIVPTILLIGVVLLHGFSAFSQNASAQIQSYLKIYSEAIAQKDLGRASQQLDKIASIHWQRLEYKKAIEYLDKSLDLKKQNGSSLTKTYDDLGALHLEVWEYRKAIDYLNLASSGYTVSGKKRELIEVLQNKADAYTNLKRYKKAIDNLQEAIVLSKAIKDPDELAESYLLLSQSYEKYGDFQQSQKYAVQHQNLVTIETKKKEEATQQLEAAEEQEKALTERQVQRQQKQLEQLEAELDEVNEELQIFDADRIQLLDNLDKTQLQIKALENEQEIERLRAEETIQKQKALRNMILMIALALVLVSLSIYRGYRQEKKNKLIIQQERDKSDKLLLNILPTETASELKSNGSVKAQKHEKVNVVFTDFVGFSKYSANLDPSQIVESLDYYFRAFDNIVGKYGLEKIKTIGDAYMCVSGLTNPGPSDTKNAFLVAKEMLAFIKASKLSRPDGIAEFGIRIGVNEGPVVAGVVGSRKFQYDIWGDSVNIAARLEQNCDSNKINVSESIYKQLKDEYSFDFRGEVDMKNMGKYKMYHFDLEKQDKSIHVKS